MELLSRLRWIVIAFIALLFLILVGWGLSSIARNIFNPGDSNQAITANDDIDVGSVDVARFLVSGPIVASEEHRSYEVEVNPSVVTITLYSDYGQNEIDQKSYKNNQEAFDTFVEALDVANIDKRISGTSEEDDSNYEGACPTGKRYVYNLDDDFQRWTTSCSSSKGTAGGNRSTIRRLFNRQAPEAKDMLRGTGLYSN